jgi:hypothetical protein
MLFKIVLKSGSEEVSSMQSFVHDDNDFRTASMMAVASLFSTPEADNVACYRVFEGNYHVAEDHFFYGEKE